MINVQTSTTSDHTPQLLTNQVNTYTVCDPDMMLLLKKKKKKNQQETTKHKAGAHCSLSSPTLWNNFFHSQDDLSWQIGFSGRLASWPWKVHFLTSVSSSCWQANATNPCNKTSTRFRIRGGNCNDSRIIRCEVCPTCKSRPHLWKRTNGSLEGG